jgi:hypothetical protein
MAELRGYRIRRDFVQSLHGDRTDIVHRPVISFVVMKHSPMLCSTPLDLPARALYFFVDAARTSQSGEERKVDP